VTIPEPSITDRLIRRVLPDAHDRPTFAVEDPATCKHLADVPDRGKIDATAAVDAAARTAESWAAIAPRARAET
jgi:succinate-semialdehyde dehydrogenase/glutarate-semialdehyde dehydrogenase